MKTVLAIVDASRTLPPNFENTHLEAYQMLPECAMPDGACSGKASFTKRDSLGRTIEVQLSNKCFYVKSCVVNGTKKPYRVKGKSPQCSWAALGSAEAAWKEAVDKAGGWD